MLHTQYRILKAIGAARNGEGLACETIRKLTRPLSEVKGLHAALQYGHAVQNATVVTLSVVVVNFCQSLVSCPGLAYPMVHEDVVH